MTRISRCAVLAGHPLSLVPMHVEGSYFHYHQPTGVPMATTPVHFPGRTSQSLTLNRYCISNASPWCEMV